MSSALQRFFTEQSSDNLGQYNKHPVLHIDVSGVVGKVIKKTDAKGSFYEVSLLSTGENADYPKGFAIKPATVRESKSLSPWSLADNNLVLGLGKGLLGFGIREIEISSKHKVRGISAFQISDIPYPDHKILNLSVAFSQGGQVQFLEGPKLCVPKTVLDNPDWQAAAQSQHHNLDIGV